MQDTLSLYEKALSAQVYWAKNALLVGQWKDQAGTSLPGGLQCGKKNLKVLGVFLCTEKFQTQNWEGAKEKMGTQLYKWK